MTAPVHASVASDRSRPAGGGRAADHPVRSGPAEGRFVGTARLLRLALRRDRVRIAVWALATAALVGLSAGSVADLYKTPEQLASYVRISKGNAAAIVQSGPGYGLDHPTSGAVLMNETAIWAIVLAALLAIMMTTRHTRLEEETARAELLRSAPIGRHAASAAGILAVLVAEVALAVAAALAVIIPGFGVAGAGAFAAALVGAGLAFSAVTLVAAQIASSSRVATGIGLTVLGVSFVVRAVGDVSAPWLSWASPIHWAQGVRVYAGEQWWALALPVVVGSGLIAVATRLTDRRDFGSGLLEPRPGRAEATRRLVSPLALSVRLLRGAIVGWAVAIAAMGFFYGVVADQAQKMVEDNPGLEDFLAALGKGSITDAFLATGILVLALMASGFVVSAVLRMHAEEAANRIDPILATPVSRRRWALGHLAVVAVALVGLMASGGLAQGFGAAVTTGEWSQLGRNLAAALAMAPAPAVLGAVAFLLCAAAPRWTPVAWGVMVLSAAMGLLAEVLGLPMWVRDLSPFQHVPPMPAAEFALEPVLLLCAVAVALTVAGVRALVRRDIAMG